MSSPLHIDVFVVPYKPIVGLIAPMGEGEATWPPTSVSLISGEHDAVLIDALLTPEDAGRVVDWIRATGKNLTTIYITHGHSDHFFGLNTILAAFPNARAVTAAAVIPDARTQLSPDLMSFWNAIFPGQIPAHPIVPDALDGDVIELEGHELRVITVGQSDTFASTIVSIPSLDAVVAGDVAYNGIHQWLAQTDHEKRMQWIASVGQIEALKPKIVVAGHKRPDARDDNPATILGDTKTYIRDFDQSLAESHSAQELVDKMMVLHGNLGNPYTLWTAAQGVFEAGAGRIVVSRLATQPARAIRRSHTSKAERWRRRRTLALSQTRSRG
jgi:glyoxylase-like metal-dependent hydrolase (beta-lactamase superfamily II)